MADYIPFPPFRASDSDRPGGAPIQIPVLLGCAGRCGMVCSVNWPTDPQLGDVHQALRVQGWVLATAEIAGLPFVGAGTQAMAPLCGACARGKQQRARLSPGRAPTLRRP